MYRISVCSIEKNTFTVNGLHSGTTRLSYIEYGYVGSLANSGNEQDASNFDF